MQICFINRRISRYIQINPETVEITWPSVLLKLSLMSVSLEDRSSQSRKNILQHWPRLDSGRNNFSYWNHWSKLYWIWLITPRNLLAILTYGSVACIYPSVRISTAVCVHKKCQNMTLKPTSVYKAWSSRERSQRISSAFTGQGKIIIHKW